MKAKEMKAKETTMETDMRDERFLEAEKSLERIKEEIAPFIKRKMSKEYSTVGEWCETSALCPPPNSKTFNW